MDFYRINEDYNRYLQNYEKEIKGSLRFNYMIPVPEECIERLIIKDVEDEKYRLLLTKNISFVWIMLSEFRKKPPGPPIPEKLWLTRFRDWSSIFFAPGT